VGIAEVTRVSGSSIPSNAAAAFLLGCAVIYMLRAHAEHLTKFLAAVMGVLACAIVAAIVWKGSTIRAENAIHQAVYRRAPSSSSSPFGVRSPASFNSGPTAVDALRRGTGQ
jgi:hypothetical protein